MKVNKFSAAAAIIAAAAFAGCSADHSSGPEVGGGAKDGSMSFNLLASPNVQIDSIGYVVHTSPADADVVDGSIPVPSTQSQHVPVLGIQSLSSGDYTLQLSASGKLPDGTTVPCTSPKTGFHVNTGANSFVGDIAITCTITQQSDTTGSATADASVNVVTNTVGSVLETFTYGPRSVPGTTVGGACTFPPITLKVANSNASIHYSWAATPDGTFTLNSTNTSGTYNCASPGDKTLTLTGTLNGTTSTKNVTVTCQPCGVCGNGILEAGEQCDDSLPHCQACKIVPICGDNIIDAPETCEPPNTATCGPTCMLASCGDGHVDPGEQCDNGANNSNTAPNACRTNCKTASCGDGVVDTGEQCDPPNGTTCSATCQNVMTGPICGNGIVETGEQCDPPNGTTCSATCQNIPPHVACETCLSNDSTDGPFETGYCLNDTKCKAVQDCVIDAKCFNPIPALCYCGITDATACKADSFTPTGPCVTQIAAGAGPLTIGAAGTNTTALARVFDSNFSTGIGMLLLNDAATTAGVAGECNKACFP
jgi:hypothetical protein